LWLKNGLKAQKLLAQGTPWGCMNPARRPGGFAIRRKKRFDLLKLGDFNPPTKGKAYSFAADCKSAEPK